MSDSTGKKLGDNFPVLRLLGVIKKKAVALGHSIPFVRKLLANEIPSKRKVFGRELREAFFKIRVIKHFK